MEGPSVVHSAFADLPSTPRLPPGTMVTLHLYMVSGEFVAAATEPATEGIERFVQHLEEGLITPELDKKYRFGDERRDDFGYALVWNGIELLDGRIWEDLVLDHGLSLHGPNDIIVVITERMRVQPPPSEPP